jgi:hypothetical protein
MTTELLTVPVRPETARAFAALTDQQRRKAEIMLDFHLLDIVRTLTDPNAPTLIEVMDAVAAEAARNGLTEEELEDILNEPRGASGH